MEEIETLIVNDEILKSFISCHRKAFLLEKEARQRDLSQKNEKLYFKAKYEGMVLFSKADDFVEMNGQKFVVLDVHSATIRERHKISASFLAFIMALNKNEIPISFRTPEGLKIVYPRIDKAKQILLKIKEILSRKKAPNPTFSFACRNCPFHTECVEFASKEGDISMINGIGEGRKKALQKAGYSTINEVSKADPKLLAKYMGINVQQAQKIVLQALSVNTSKWFLVNNKDKDLKIFNRNYEYFFDVEKAADETYLFGILLKEKNEVTYRYFLLLENEWKVEWENFLNFVNVHPRTPIYHYDVFDRNVMEKFAFMSSKNVDRTLKRFQDMYNLVKRYFVVPVRFYSLKDVAKSIGFNWRVENFNGYEAMKQLTEWKNKKDKALLQKIVEYNEDDCRALMVVKEKVSEMMKRSEK
ncbi:TM0106 family RecB-like putative nuclease [Mesoaciditoga sp.]